VIAWRLGWRGLWLRPKRTWIALASLALGIGGLLFLSALNAGWMEQIRRNFAATLLGQLQLRTLDWEQDPSLAHGLPQPKRWLRLLKQTEGVLAAALRIQVDGLAQSAHGAASVVIYGVQPEEEARITRIASSLIQGRWLRAGELHGVVLGERLAEVLGVGLGKKLVLSAVGADGEIRSWLARVVGVVRTGAWEVDRGAAFLSYAAASRWLQQELPTMIVVGLRNPELAPSVASRLQKKLPQGIVARSWEAIDPVARAFVRFAEGYAWTMLGIVIVLVVVEAMHTLLMSVEERMSEFALLIALGAAPRVVAQAVWVEASALVWLGTMAGVALGAVASWLGAVVGIDLSRFAEALRYLYLDPVLHPVLRATDLLRIVLAALFGAWMAAFFPAWRALRADPAVHLRGRA